MLLACIAAGAIAAVFGGVWAAARSLPSVQVAVLKAAGRVDPACSWRDSVDAFNYERARLTARVRVANETRLLERDGDMLLWESPYGVSWISGAQELRDAQFRAPDVHHWPPRWAQDEAHPLVRPGDVVIDAGGHIGESAAMALRLGAFRVVTIEPDPLSAEALRRNLAVAITDGRLAVIEQGVWSAPGRLSLERGEASTMTSLEESGTGPTIPVTTVDTLVQELGLPRVDVIKMDIEGAEPEALRGARETLRRFKPRLAIGAYHEAGDRNEIPEIVLAARPDYSIRYARCLPAHGRIIPHELFFD